MTVRIPVVGTSPYDVVIGHALDAELVTMLPRAERVVVVVDRAVTARAELIAGVFADRGVSASVEVIDGGEHAKSYDAATSLWTRFAEVGITRSDAVVAMGGGATTDLVGFAAACWLRGVRVVHVPTTLLGMVDAAVGGKTGINTSAGKNLVGAFHPPAGVVVDLDRLATLPRVEWVNGMAEVVKTGFVADPEILDIVERGDAARPGPATAELVERAIRVKADVVGRDLTEAGPREVLNYGHTLGHAIERHSRYEMPHGHAVSIGMVFAAALGRLAGRLDDETAQRHRAVLTQVGLPTSYPADAWDDLLSAMAHDKKARGSALRFVVLNGLASPGILTGPSAALLRAAYTEVAA